MSKLLAPVLGGAAGAVALVVLVIVILWFCLCHNRNVSRTSDTGSSDQSMQRNLTFSRCICNENTIYIRWLIVLFCCLSVGRNTFELTLREAKRFSMEELFSATKDFNDRNLIGEGKFGEVYKGLLHDGMLVAIKKRPGAPSQEFIEEVIMAFDE